MKRRKFAERLLSHIAGGFWVVLAVLLTPFREVRFGFIDPMNIGHFLYSWVDLIRLRNCSLKKPIVLWQVFEPVSNQTLMELFRRELQIRFSLFGVRSAHAFCKRLGLRRYIFTNVEWDNPDPDSILAVPSSPPSLAWHPLFNSSDLWLKEICRGRPIACIHIRDDSYGASRRFKGIPTEEEAHFRNPQVSTYMPAVRDLIGSGYFVIRMGSLVKDPLPCGSKFFFDYSTYENRSDFLDIFVISQCQLFVASCSGLSYVPVIFGRPVLFTNHFPGMILTSYPKAVGLFVSILSEQAGRYLDYREAAALWNNGHLLTSDLRKMGLRIDFNNDEEIRRGVQTLLRAMKYGFPEQAREDLYAQREVQSDSCTRSLGCLQVDEYNFTKRYGNPLQGVK
jgi:putative glycosyltransferase (TIGR04372 family)